jgi:hypothetical protein
MTSEPKIPDRAEFRQAWDTLDKDARRRVRRAATGGVTPETANEARLAASMADSQLRFWRFGWLIGPVAMGLLQIPNGPEAVLVNVLAALLAFGLLGFFFHRRARKAKARAIEVVAESNRKRKQSGQGRAKEGRGKNPRGKKRKR